MTWWWRNLFSSYLRARFSEELQRKWMWKTVNVIVKKNKSTTLFHGLCFYGPWKWRQNVQNFGVKPLLLNFEHFDVISIVDRVTDHGKLLIRFVNLLVEAAWPSGQRVGLAIRRSRVRVPLWPLAGFVLCRPEFKFSATLVNSQLVAFCQLGFLILLCCIWIICF